MDYKAILDGLVEQLAAIEHARWSHWQRHMHGTATKQLNGSMVIPAELVVRWEKQMLTDYTDLSDGEKQSDRDQVERYLPLIVKELQKQRDC